MCYAGEVIRQLYIEYRLISNRSLIYIDIEHNTSSKIHFHIDQKWPGLSVCILLDYWLSEWHVSVR